MSASFEYSQLTTRVVHMIELVYVSKAATRFSADEIKGMLNGFRHKNQALGVTGLLLYDGLGTFIQALEGDSEVLHQLYSKITKDNRHSRVNLLGESKITARSFPDWRMGFKNLDLSPTTTELSGYSDFLEHTDRTGYLNTQPNFAFELLQHFKLSGKSNLDED